MQHILEMVDTTIIISNKKTIPINITNKKGTSNVPFFVGHIHYLLETFIE